MGKKRKLVESCNHQPRLQSAASLSSLTSFGDCHICGKEPVGPAKKLFSTRKKSRHDDIIVNFKIPNPVSLFSNRVTKKTPFFANLKVWRWQFIESKICQKHYSFKASHNMVIMYHVILQVKCHPIGSCPLVQKRSKWSLAAKKTLKGRFNHLPNQNDIFLVNSLKKWNAWLALVDAEAGGKSSQVAQGNEIALDEDLYCIPHEVAVQSGS